MKILLTIAFVCLLTLPVMAQQATITVKSNDKTFYLTDSAGNRLASLELDGQDGVMVKREAEREPTITVLISRERALEIYAGKAIERGDFLLFTAKTKDTEVRGKEFVTFRAEMFESIGTANTDRGLLIALLKLHIPVKKNPCHFGSRGQDCLVHGKDQK